MKAKRARKIILWSVLVLAVLATLAAILPLPPRGHFATPQVGCLADSYYEFKDGEYWHVVFDGDRGRDGKEERQFIGHYRKEHGQWIVDVGDGKPGQVRVTLFSLQFIEPDGRRSGRFYRYWH